MDDVAGHGDVLRIRVGVFHPTPSDVSITRVIFTPAYPDNHGHVKCNALKQSFAGEPPPQIVPIDRFLDGNDDLGSIGCNLMEHPGIDAFRHAFALLQSRPDVQAIYAQISELDPGEGSWPFTDTGLVIGSIGVEELQKAISHLRPDEVGPGDPEHLPPALCGPERRSALVAWWD